MVGLSSFACVATYILPASGHQPTTRHAREAILRNIIRYLWIGVQYVACVCSMVSIVVKSRLKKHQKVGNLECDGSPFYAILKL